MTPPNAVTVKEGKKLKSTEGAPGAMQMDNSIELKRP